MKRFALTTACLLVTAYASAAGTPADAAFAKLSKLVGTWVGKADDMDGKIVYKLTGSGSALIETMCPDTPMEMVTVYTVDGPNLVATHYCGAHNQPHLKLVPGKAGSVLDFKVFSVGNMKPKASYVCAIQHRLVAADRMESDWVFATDGSKKLMTMKFKMSREKAK